MRPTSILLGVLVDKVSFVVWAVSLAAVAGVSSPFFQALVLPGGLTATLLGGFAAASHARTRFVAHGFAVGIVALTISFGRFVVNGIWPPEQAAAAHPLGWELIGWGGALVAGALGGFLARVRARRAADPVQARAGAARWAVWLPVLLGLVALAAFSEQL